MIGPRTRFLLSISTPALSGSAVGALHQGRLGDELQEMLSARNGFYAFESALLVRWFGPGAGNLLDWNSSRSWRKGYGPDAQGLLFFAEDVFGSQFAIKENQVFRFDAETGEANAMASSLEDFVDQLLDDYNYLTGYPLAKEWQHLHGPLQAGDRLVAIRPFVLGGEFDVANLQSVRDTEGMIARSKLARQIRGVSDGTKVRIAPE